MQIELHVQNWDVRDAEKSAEMIFATVDDPYNFASPSASLCHPESQASIAGSRVGGDSGREIELDDPLCCPKLSGERVIIFSEWVLIEHLQIYNLLPQMCTYSSPIISQLQLQQLAIAKRESIYIRCTSLDQAACWAARC